MPNAQGDADGFFCFEVVVNYEFLPQGQAVNKEYYLEVMERLREAVREKNPWCVAVKTMDAPSWERICRQVAPYLWLLVQTREDNRPKTGTRQLNLFCVLPETCDLTPADLFVFKASIKVEWPPFWGNSDNSINSKEFR